MIQWIYGEGLKEDKNKIKGGRRDEEIEKKGDEEIGKSKDGEIEKKKDEKEE